MCSGIAKLLIALNNVGPNVGTQDIRLAQININLPVAISEYFYQSLACVSTFQEEFECTRLMKILASNADDSNMLV